MIELGINLGPESGKHIRRCYDTAARIINVSTHQNGKRYLPREVANPFFLEIRDVPIAIYVVRSLFAKIWDRCFEEANNDNSTLFVWICDFLGAYYSKVTGIPLDKHCTELQQKFIEANNRRMARKLNGTPNNPNKKFREPIQGPIMTVGDEYGDVLDEAAKAITKQRRERVNPKERAYEDDAEREEQLSKPHPKQKLRPAVITVETAESVEEPTEKFEESEQENLGSMSEAFDKSDLL